MRRRTRIPAKPIVKKDDREDVIGQISARALASYPKEAFEKIGLQTTTDLPAPKDICVYIMMDMPINTAGAHPVGNRTTRRTYVGYTIDIAHRWRQHSRLISGGAKCTGRFVCCIPLAIISGFPSRQTALQYEWRLKKLRLHKATRHLPVFARRERSMVELFKLTHATRSAVPLAEFRQNLCITWGCVPNISTIQQLRQLGLLRHEGLEWPSASRNMLTTQERKGGSDDDMDSSADDIESFSDLSDGEGMLDGSV